MELAEDVQSLVGLLVAAAPKTLLSGPGPTIALSLEVSARVLTGSPAMLVDLPGCHEKLRQYYCVSLMCHLAYPNCQ